MASRPEEASPGWARTARLNSMLDAGECKEGARRPSGVGWRVGAGELAGRRQRAVLRRQCAGRTVVADGTGGGGTQRTRQRRAVGRAAISRLVWMHNVNDLGVLILGKGKPKMVEMIQGERERIMVRLGHALGGGGGGGGDGGGGEGRVFLTSTSSSRRGFFFSSKLA